jgi:hypothetical protein
MRGDLGQLAERVLLLTVRPNEDTRVHGRDIIEELVGEVQDATST